MKRTLNKSVGFVDELIEIFLSVEEQLSVRNLRGGDVCLHLLTNTTTRIMSGFSSQRQKETGFSKEEEIFADGDETVNDESQSLKTGGLCSE